ncbi:MAG TPA: GGDEF domain-containing protein [Candidatus Baltobacteraceae bacterium]|nr:GGDEF domain-containing protein [Candidatus Baltobacteraceae bacterium]
MRRLAAALALAAILFPLGAAAAEEAAVARLPSDPAAPASLFRPTVLSGVFRVPRVDTSLYVAAPWLARDLSVVIVRRDGRRQRLDADASVPGAILGVRLPADAFQADRIEYEAHAVSSLAVPYVVSADALALLNARTWPYAAAFGAFAALGCLLAVAASLRRSRVLALLTVTAFAQALLLIPWLGIVRPSPLLSQPMHALLQALLIVSLASVVLTVASSLGVRGRFAAVARRATWSLAAAASASVFGADLFQDLWAVPPPVETLAALGCAAALLAAAARSLSSRAPAARALVCGACLFLLATVARTVVDVPIAALVASLGGTLALAFAAALIPRARRAAAEETHGIAPAPAVPETAAVAAPVPDIAPARPIFGAPPPRELLADGLTGIANRSALSAALDRAWTRCAADGTPVGMLRVDLDHFRRYNDAHGPDAGDDALCRIAVALGATLPPSLASALVARDGGDEFCILLPGATLAATQAHGERVRSAIDALAIARDDVPARRLTASVGAASLEPASAEDPFALFARANAALYIAKAMGRDRVVADEPVQTFAKSESAKL